MKYRLLEPHYLYGKYLEAGYVIGDGTDIPFLEDLNGKPVMHGGRPSKPTPAMEGLDEASQQAVALVTGQYVDPLIGMTPEDAPVVDLSNPSAPPVPRKPVVPPPMHERPPIPPSPTPERK